eukprot:CAMPEP_0201548926 /NCGR_PEP_ID=MMETSP0173_2-20130828/5432_1 /ASSEMBLY_ACC=CAM_ASM_000268 /TAXON_ID=218659 /ORGANISM="Vexillifera sp., Strain DIVA3 564/2" /LENGTH=656 /DNA_ID=CAMNT_0047958447 /DNA_START=535 /DNA_END=2505 /DNA_ORIENTATION=-
MCWTSIQQHVNAQSSDEILKVGFIFNGKLSHQWSYEHDIGRHTIASLFRNEILTTAKYDIPEWDVEASQKAMQELIDTGHKLIFTTSSGYLASTPEMALKNPDIQFVQVPGFFFDIPNLKGIDVRLYEAYYLGGLIAGSLTQTNRIGMINGEPGIALTVLGTNGFAIGAKTVNPDVEVFTTYTLDWVDVRKHQQATYQLLDLNCDTVFAVSGSLVPDQIVADVSASTGRRLMSFGFASDFRVTIGPTVISSAVFTWGSVYSKIIEEALNTDGSNWGEVLSGGMVDGYSDAAPPSENVPTDVADLFWSERERILSSEKTQEVIFCGEWALGLPDMEPGPDGCLTLSQVASIGYDLPWINVIEGEFFYVDVYLESDDPGAIAMYVVNSLALFISILYVIGVLYYHKTPVIHYASPVFCAFIFLGGFLQYISGYLYVEKPTDAICMAPVWLQDIGYVIMLAAICVKNWRMWVIHRKSRKFKLVQVPSWQLFAGLLIAITLMIVLLIAWQVDDPLEETYTLDPIDLEVDERYLSCEQSDEALWVGLTLGYISFWVISAAAFAYLTRGIRSLFNESHLIALAVYNIIVLDIITLPLIYTFDEKDYEAKTILSALRPIYRAFSTLSLIFFPKLWLAIFKPEENVLASTGSRGSSNRSERSMA